MSEFISALIPSIVSPSQKEKLNLFGQFVGDWKFEWIDGKDTPNERHVMGEWLFTYAFNGQGIQDLFICPSRDERIKSPQPDGEYGTTIRILDEESNTWHICYACNNAIFFLKVIESTNNKIILVNLSDNENVNQWLFSDITENSFHWQNRTLTKDDTWIINGELYAKRK